MLVLDYYLLLSEGLGDVGFVLFFVLGWRIEIFGFFEVKRILNNIEIVVIRRVSILGLS